MSALSITLRCPTCKKAFRIKKWAGETKIDCPYGAHGITLFSDGVGHRLSHCAVCGGRDFYREKKFPKALGLTILGAGIVTSFFTYGLSLAAVAALDALLYAVLPWRIVCYGCRAGFCGLEPTADTRPFDLHLYEQVRARTFHPA